MLFNSGICNLFHTYFVVWRTLKYRFGTADNCCLHVKPLINGLLARKIRKFYELASGESVYQLWRVVHNYFGVVRHFLLDILA